MSLHYLEVNAMMSRAQDCMYEAHGVFAWHVGIRKPLDDEDYERLNRLLSEIEAIAEKLQEVNMWGAAGWPDWALDEIESKDDSLRFGSEVLTLLKRHYLELF